MNRERFWKMRKFPSKVFQSDKMKNSKENRWMLSMRDMTRVKLCYSVFWTFVFCGPTTSITFWKVWVTVPAGINRLNRKTKWEKRKVVRDREDNSLENRRHDNGACLIKSLAVLIKIKRCDFLLSLFSIFVFKNNIVLIFIK